MIEAAPGLYIHVPFCSGKCPYCDFYSLAAPGLIRLWLDALVLEMERRAGSFGSFDTLYLGGGTPSHLPGDVLSELLERLQSVFTFGGQPEVTLEANPEDVTPEKIRLALAHGVNRISLGVQSLEDGALRFLGRRHSALEARRAVDVIREADCRNLSLDLMYGLPGQSETEWLDVLARTVALEPEHLSCYQLTVEPDTPFGRLARRGDMVFPGEETGRSLFLSTSRFLEDHGFIHYEVSSFSRGRSCDSRHNWKYWRHTPYLGLGPAAHSFSEGRRWWNRRSIRRYAADLASGNDPVAGAENLTAGQLALEALYLGLRTIDGIDVSLIGAHGAAVDRWVEEGLAVRRGGRLVLTRSGLVMADHLTLALTD